MIRSHLIDSIIKIKNKRIGLVDIIKTKEVNSLINLLKQKEELKPSHVMLQINFGDMNSSFYFEGPSFGSENGFGIPAIIFGTPWKSVGPPISSFGS